MTFRSNPVVLLLGPRQCGKTTLARELGAVHKAEYFDLEAPSDRRRLDQPMTARAPLRGWVVIDEAQMQPGLFPILCVLVDRQPLPTRFLLLGSASPDLVSGISESLAGQVALIPMAGFDLSEVKTSALRTLWWRGGFPRTPRYQAGSIQIYNRRNSALLLRVTGSIAEKGGRLP